MWCDQPPQIPASVPSPPRCSISSWTESTETLYPEVAFLGVFCPGNTSSNWCPRRPRKYIIQICLTHVYCNTPSDVIGSLKSDLGQRSKYFLVSVCARTSPLAIYIQNLGSCNHFRVLPFFLQREQELQPAPAQPSSPFSSSLMYWPAI